MTRSALILAILAATPALAGDTSPARLIAGYEAAAGRAADPAAGKALFLASHGTGKPDTPACTTCHTDNPRVPGQTRTGKMIDPMASSVTPDRFSETKKVEKWFGRNCDSVLGRACTAAEKADIIAWLSSL